MQIINPATEELVKVLDADSAQSVENKFRLLTNAQPTWAQVPRSERIAMLARFSTFLSENIESLAPILVVETGKPLQQARNEINGACTRINWITAHAEQAG